MGLFGWLGSLFGGCDDSNSPTSIGGSLGTSGWDEGCSINPANGMPMVGGFGGFDVAGNPYGTDSSHSGSDFSSSRFGSSFDSWNS